MHAYVSVCITQVLLKASQNLLQKAKLVHAGDQMADSSGADTYHREMEASRGATSPGGTHSPSGSFTVGFTHHGQDRPAAVSSDGSASPGLQTISEHRGRQGRLASHHMPSDNASAIMTSRRVSTVGASHNLRSAMSPTRGTSPSRHVHISDSVIIADSRQSHGMSIICATSPDRRNLHISDKASVAGSLMSRQSLVLDASRSAFGQQRQRNFSSDRYGGGPAGADGRSVASYKTVATTHTAATSHRISSLDRHTNVVTKQGVFVCAR